MKVAMSVPVPGERAQVAGMPSLLRTSNMVSINPIKLSDASMTATVAAQFIKKRRCIPLPVFRKPPSIYATGLRQTLASQGCASNGRPVGR